MKFRIQTNGAVANALRRIITSEIKTYAIEITAIRHNTSSLLDDMVAHRLGLIPIRVLDELRMEKEEGIIVLKCENNKTTKQYIYTNDLVYDHTLYEINPNILLFELREGQYIDLKCEVTQGTGYEHAKWSPVYAISCVPAKNEGGDKGGDEGDEECKDYIIDINSVGQIPQEKEILAKALEILENKIQIIIKHRIKTDGSK